jgi:AcrR family transcriptional regulator
MLLIYSLLGKTCERVQISLDSWLSLGYYLNMFNKAEPNAGMPRKRAGDRTKDLILEKALELFRKRGFEVTTMREIAQAAKVATGAAYYYFPSKEAIVAAYYDEVQRLHAVKVREELLEKEGLGPRLACVMHSKLDILWVDRKLLGALFRYSGEPGHPLSVFGKATEAQRKQSMEVFREALAGIEIGEELKEVLPWGMWLLHLGMILYFIHDDSEGQGRTHRLVDRFAGMLAGLVELANSALVRPFVKPLQAKMLEALHEAGWSKEV